MNNLNKLLAAQTPEQMQDICIAEFLTVDPHTYTQTKICGDGNEHQIQITINSISSSDKMLVVEADCLLDGNFIEVDNPLCFMNASILVADGSFETMIDEVTGQTYNIPNTSENAELALQKHILSAIEETVLKGTAWVR